MNALTTDQGEAKNLADSLKAKTAELASELQKWRQEVYAQMPLINKYFKIHN